MPVGRQVVDTGSGIAVTMQRTKEGRAGKKIEGKQNGCGRACFVEPAPHSTVLSPSRQLLGGAAHSVKKTLVECRHFAHVRSVGENHFLLQLLCDDVGRERGHAATLAPVPHLAPAAVELDGASLVDRQLRQVQTTVIRLDDRRDGRLDV